MQKEDIFLTDWKRILFGSAPPMFMVEVLIRTLVIYLGLILIVRLLGKRMTGQITITEMAVMVTLGAIIAVPMQVPDHGIILGLFILGCALGFQRGLNWLTSRSARFETVVQDQVGVLVEDGVLQLEEMNKARVSREQLFAVLRNRNVRHLGKIRRLYLESCGLFSLYHRTEEVAGLSLLPDSDPAAREVEQPGPAGQRACGHCGWVMPTVGKNERCPNCDAQRWQQAVR
jgi:uncharacterized membrane protein YcaP (DUF421 family)